MVSMESDVVSEQVDGGKAQQILTDHYNMVLITSA